MDGLDLSRVRVMLVEHEPDAMTLFKRMLKAFSCTRIIAAADGDEAFHHMAQDLAPDAIIAEYDIPPDNGVAFVRRVRTDPQSPNRFVPIILTSANWQWAQIAAARDAGVNEILVKPVSAKALGLRVDAVINRPRPFVQIDDYFGPDRRRQDKDYGGRERRRKQVPLLDADADAAPAPSESTDGAPTQESIDKYLES